MKLDKIFSGLNVAAFGLKVQRKRMDAVAENIANVETTRTDEGTPYKRKVVQVKQTSQTTFIDTIREQVATLSTTNSMHIQASDVEVPVAQSPVRSVDVEVTEDDSSFKMAYDPSHPDANPEGYVRLPNVNIVAEMVNMISATRAYEANVTVINAEKSMAKDSLEI